MQGAATGIDGGDTGRRQYHMFLFYILANISQKGRFTRTRLPGQKHGLAGILYETQSILELFVAGIYGLGQDLVINNW